MYFPYFKVLAWYCCRSVVSLCLKPARTVCTNISLAMIISNQLLYSAPSPNEKYIPILNHSLCIIVTSFNAYNLCMGCVHEYVVCMMQLQVKNRFIS